MSHTSHTIVDLETIHSVNDLARRLGTLRFFLDAAHELITCSQLSNSDFQRHSPQIIFLMETARTTLTRAGIKLHLFTSCPPALIPYKAVYYDLLAVLRHKRPSIEPNLRDQLNRLLFALSTRFVIIRQGDSSHLNWPLDSDAWSRWRTTPSRSIRHRISVSSTSSQEPDKYANLMPPPDAFPPGRSELSIDPSSQRGRIARRTSRSSVSGSSVRRAASPRRQSHPRLRADPPTENTPPSTQSRPVCGVRQRRSFGIFCTGKKSVVGRPVERRGRDVGR